MGAKHAILINGTSAATAIEVEIPAPTGYRVGLISARFGQSNREKDAASEQLAVTVTAGVTTSSGGTSVNSLPRNNNAAAIGCKVNTTNLSTSGTAQHVDAFNNLGGWREDWPIEDERIYTAASGILAVKVEAPSASTTWYATLVFEVV